MYHSEDRTWQKENFGNLEVHCSEYMEHTHLFQGAGDSMKSQQPLTLSNNSMLPLWNPEVHYHAHKSPPPILS